MHIANHGLSHENNIALVARFLLMPFLFCLCGLIMAEEKNITKYPTPAERTKKGAWNYLGRVESLNRYGDNQKTADTAIESILWGEGRCFFFLLYLHQNKYGIAIRWNADDHLNADEIPICDIYFVMSNSLQEAFSDFKEFSNNALDDGDKPKNVLRGGVNNKGAAKLKWSVEEEYVADIFLHGLASESPVPLVINRVESRILFLERDIKRTVDPNQLDVLRKQLDYFRSIKLDFEKGEYKGKPILLIHAQLKGHIFVKKHGLDPL